MTTADDPTPPQSAIDDRRAWRSSRARAGSIPARSRLCCLSRRAAPLWFADEANAGHFFDRLPHLFDFLSWLIPQGLERCLAGPVRSAVAL